jgi:hypothetical protein
VKPVRLEELRRGGQDEADCGDGGGRDRRGEARAEQISEDGASATPKNAVLMFVANVSPLNREYSTTPITMHQTFRRFFPNSAKPRTRNRHATAAPVIFAPAL